MFGWGGLWNLVDQHPPSSERSHLEGGDLKSLCVQSIFGDFLKLVKKLSAELIKKCRLSFMKFRNANFVLLKVL